MIGWSNHPYPSNRYPASLWRSSSACDGPFSQPTAAKQPWASFAPFSWIAREDGRRWDVLSRTSTANWKRLEFYPKVVTALSSSSAADVVGHSCLSSSPSASRAIGAKKQAPPESGSAASCPLRSLRWPQRDPDRQMLSRGEGVRHLLLHRRCSLFAPARVGNPPGSWCKTSAPHPPSQLWAFLEKNWEKTF